MTNIWGYKVIAQILSTYNPSPKKVLEIGCGHGGFVGVLCKAGFDTYGLDKYKTGFGASGTHRFNDRLILADAQNIPFKNQFNAVVSNSLLSVVGLETIAGFDGSGYLILDSGGELEKPNKGKPEVVARNIHKSVHDVLTEGGIAIHIVPHNETVIAPPKNLYESKEVTLTIDDGAKQNVGLVLRKI